MVLDKLGSSLRDSLQKLAKSVFVSDKVLNDLIKDIQRALLQSDVNVKLVFELSKHIKERAKNEELPSGVTKREQLVNIVYDELVNFVGGDFEPIKFNPDKKPFKIMLVGLFGNGKTTTAGKLAKYYTKRGMKVACIQTDTWRPAAYEQLKTNTENAGADFFGISPDPKRKTDETYPVEIYKQFEKNFSKYDLVIIDTAGRDALSDDLIKEIELLDAAVNADEKLLVIGADLGQTAEKQAKAFNDSCGVSGVIITKMDGTAKGGGALSACSVTNSKVRFLGVGEGISDFEEFKPKNFIGRLLGMGDLETLLEKVQDSISVEDAQNLQERMLSGNFSLNDMYDQLKAMKKLGPLNKVMNMIPGMGGMNIPKEALQEQEKNLDIWKYIMDSCTKKELSNPDLINGPRIHRLAKGSGRDETEVRNMLKQYKQSKKMMKSFKGGGSNPKNMEKMMKRMGGMKGLNMGFK